MSIAGRMAGRFLTLPVVHPERAVPTLALIQSAWLDNDADKAGRPLLQ